MSQLSNIWVAAKGLLVCWSIHRTSPTFKLFYWQVLTIWATVCHCAHLFLGPGQQKLCALHLPSSHWCSSTHAGALGGAVGRHLLCSSPGNFTALPSQPRKQVWCHLWPLGFSLLQGLAMTSPWSLFSILVIFVSFVIKIVGKFQTEEHSWISKNYRDFKGRSCYPLIRDSKTLG